jgi:hypothetical protein
MGQKPKPNNRKKTKTKKQAAKMKGYLKDGWVQSVETVGQMR